MTQKLVTAKVNLYQYPKKFYGNLGSVTIGDLHGNSIKFLHFLLRHNVVQFKNTVTDPNKAYSDFVGLYERLADLVQLHRELIPQGRKVKVEIFKELIKQFNAFMDLLEVPDKKALVRLIGDELADRGANDYLTLRLLKFLKMNDVPVRILFSNHGAEFLKLYKQGKLEQNPKPEFISVENLKCLIKLGIVDKNETDQIVKEVYKPSLILLDYTIDDHIDFFSHAPIEFFTALKYAALKLGVVYKDGSNEHIAATIEKVNIKFQQLVREDKIGPYLDWPRGIDETCMTLDQIKKYPLFYIIWNRLSYENEETRPALKNGVSARYNNGHSPEKSLFKHVTTFDTLNGKIPRSSQERRYDNIEGTEIVLDSDAFCLKQKYTIEFIDEEFRRHGLEEKKVDEKPKVKPKPVLLPEVKVLDSKPLNSSVSNATVVEVGSQNITPKPHSNRRISKSVIIYFLLGLFIGGVIGTASILAFSVPLALGIALSCLMAIVLGILFGVIAACKENSVTPVTITQITQGEKVAEAKECDPNPRHSKLFQPEANQISGSDQNMLLINNRIPDKKLQI